MKKIILKTILIFITFPLFPHELTIKEIQNLPTKIFRLQFADNSPYAYEKCNLQVYKNNQFQTIQTLFTDSEGILVFVPKEIGKYKIICFREDGHGINYDFSIHTLNNSETSIPIENKENLFVSMNRSFYGIIVAGLIIVSFIFLRLFNKSKIYILIGFYLVSISYIHAHHGIASLGKIGILGPGSAIETSNQSLLPKGQYLFYTKLDEAKFKTLTPERDEEMDLNRFFMYGFGYGINSYLSFYLFAPYNQKTLENQKFNTAGFADLSVYLVLGFKYDEQFYLNPENESLDDLQDYHFSIYLGSSVPTGNPNIKDSEGNIDPGMSSGFGKPAPILGFTISKFYENFTWNMDISYLRFEPYKYANKVKTKFGDEFRFNLALIYRIFSNQEKQFRLDTFLEWNYLKIKPDTEKGIDQKSLYQYLAFVNQIAVSDSTLNEQVYLSTVPPWEIENYINDIQSTSYIPESNLTDVLLAANGIATSPSGGEIHYLTPGFRVYYKNISFAFGLKFPVIYIPNKIDLNKLFAIDYLRYNLDNVPFSPENVYWNNKVLEKNLYQGSEGMEKYRLIITFSFLI